MHHLFGTRGLWVWVHRSWFGGVRMPFYWHLFPENDGVWKRGKMMHRKRVLISCILPEVSVDLLRCRYDKMHIPRSLKSISNPEPREGLDKELPDAAHNWSVRHQYLFANGWNERTIREM